VNDYRHVRFFNFNILLGFAGITIVYSAAKEGGFIMNTNIAVKSKANNHSRDRLLDSHLGLHEDVARLSRLKAVLKLEIRSLKSEYEQTVAQFKQLIKDLEGSYRGA
jgi:hypothetical protein